MFKLTISTVYEVATRIYRDYGETGSSSYGLYRIRMWVYHRQRTPSHYRTYVGPMHYTAIMRLAIGAVKIA